MADTLDQIYMNTALGATQMDDGEETILTTNATTSYVIKDMNVSGTTNLTSTYLELNGFNVGSISSNATGSLIIPPSSTLKVKSTDYPYTYSKESISFWQPNDRLIIKNSIIENKSGASVDGKSFVSTTGLSLDTVTVRAVGQTISGTDYIFSITHDNNSVQQLRWQTSASTGGQIRYVNYAPFGFYRHSTLGLIAVVMDGYQLSYKQLTVNPTSASGWVTPNPFGTSSKTNSYSPMTTSSYPRGYVAHGYFWYVPSNSVTNQIYGINLETGAFHRFDDLQNFSVVGNAGYFTTYRASDDKFIFWKWDASTNLAYNVSSVTKTYLDGLDNNTTNLHSISDKAANTLATAINNSSMASGQLSEGTDGNLVYNRGNYGSTEVNTSNQVISSGPNDPAYIVDGTSYSTDGHLHRKERVPATSSELTAAGISAPTFGIQLLGVKSETS